MTGPGETGQSPAPAAAAPAIVFNRDFLFLAFFFTVFVFLLYQLARVLSPFLAPLLGALMLSLIFHPLHAWLERRIRNENLSAFISTVTVLFAIVVPVFILIWNLVVEAADLLPAARSWLLRTERQGPADLDSAVPLVLRDFWDRIIIYLRRWDVDLQSMSTEALRELGNTLTSFGTATVREAFQLLLNILVLVLILFFFFRDGEEIIKRIIDLVPMEDTNKRYVLARLDRTLLAIIRGGFITGSVQGLLSGIGIAVAGLPFAVLLGFTAALFSAVPFVGASLVWGPAAVYLLIDGRMLAGGGLALWGMFVVGLVDNFLRPWVVGRHAQLPVLLLFIAILGGLQVYGLIGVLVSPLVVALVLVFAQIYHDQYLQESPPVRGVEEREKA